MTNFIDRLSQPGILIADGATGTMLQNAGLPAGAAPERWNLENPDAVRALHQSYIQAGADIILTNTFGGTPLRLERDGLKSQTFEINKAAGMLAHEMAGGKTIVFGDIGPTGRLLKPVGPLGYEEAVSGFAEQAAGLAEGDVDAILIETMSDLAEAKAAVEGVRKVTQLPILVTMSFDTHGRTMMGVKPVNAAKELAALKVNVIGANCGRTLSETLEAIQQMRQALPEAILMAKPNAGLPRRADPGEGRTGEIIYDVTPAIMAEYALKFAEQGVKIFGGCCGSTPAHIQAIAKVLHH